jgi:hypothetical protein
MSGGADGKVRAWDPKLSWKNAVLEFDLSRFAQPGTQKMVSALFLHGEMRMVCACWRMGVAPWCVRVVAAYSKWINEEETNR